MSTRYGVGDTVSSLLLASIGVKNHAPVPSYEVSSGHMNTPVFRFRVILTGWPSASPCLPCAWIGTRHSVHQRFHIRSIHSRVHVPGIRSWRFISSFKRPTLTTSEPGTP